MMKLDPSDILLEDCLDLVIRLPGRNPKSRSVSRSADASFDVVTCSCSIGHMADVKFKSHWIWYVDRMTGVELNHC
jgi:hypothetical protein